MNLWKIIVLILLTSSCGEHMRTVVKINKCDYSSTIVYSTSLADYYFNKDDVQEYCQKRKNRDRNLVSILQLEKYLSSSDSKIILIPDTLGTKLASEKEVLFIESDKLIRVRDQQHPYAYVTDEIRWITIDLAMRKKVCIYDKITNTFLDTIIVDKVDTKDYGETNFIKTNDSIIFSQLRWIR